MTYSTRMKTLLALCLAALPIFAQRPDSKQLLADQREAMKVLSMMDGVWRGPAETVVAGGDKHRVTQTERIGPFLGGSIKLLEGRGYNEDGSVGFNAFAVLSYDPATKSYSLHSHAMGMKGDFNLTPTADGYVWEIPAGPMTIRYTAVIKDKKWREVGDRIMPGKDPVRFFEMNLVRVSDSVWPEVGAIQPK